MKDSSENNATRTAYGNNAGENMGCTVSADASVSGQTIQTAHTIWTTTTCSTAPKDNRTSFTSDMVKGNTPNPNRVTGVQHGNNIFRSQSPAIGIL